MTSYFKFITRDVNFRLGQQHAGTWVYVWRPAEGGHVVGQRGARQDLGGGGGSGSRGGWEGGLT
jgi:hypothetical protein